MLALPQQQNLHDSMEQAFWADICLVRQIVHKTGVAVAQLEQRMKQRNVALEMHYQNCTQHLMQVSIRAWFDSRYSVPSASSAVLASRVRITRGQLLDQMNQFLRVLELPEVQSRDTLWSQWFLTEVLGMSEQERRSGKMVLLDTRWSPDTLRHLSQHAEAYIERQQQHQQQQDMDSV